MAPRGAKSFGRVAKGAKNFRLDLFFWITEIHSFSSGFIGFGVFLIFRSKGGGRKISDASLGGVKKFRPSIFPESLGKWVHVKNLVRK